MKRVYLFSPVLLQSAASLRDERTRTEIEWLMASLCMVKQQRELPAVLRGILGDRQKLLEGVCSSRL